MPSRSSFLAKIEVHAKAAAETFARVNYWKNRTQDTITRTKQSALAEIDHRYEQKEREIEQEYERFKQESLVKLTTINQQLRLAEVGWDSDLWTTYQPQIINKIPRLVRFGSILLPIRNSTVQIPALVPIIGGRNLLILAQGGGKEKARNLIQAMVFRLIADMPAGKLRLVCVDPVGIGATMAGFIKGLSDSLTGGQAWFNEQDIEQRLVDLENHMAAVKQKYLGVSFSSMEEYNSKAGQVEEPYRLLVFSDFPSRFTDSTAQRLISIATNGPGTGVYTIGMIDEDQKKLPYNFNLSDLERTANVIEINDQFAKWLDEDFKEFQLELDNPPKVRHFEQVIAKVNEAAKMAAEVKVPFQNFMPPSTDWWGGDSRTGVQVPIGQFGAREVQSFVLNEKMLSSALIVGKTGSGKSTLLHILINGLCLHYSPKELELYLLDFKQVEFKDYAIHHLPHAKVVAVKSEREFGLSVLRGLDAELQKRKDEFKNLAALSAFRTATASDLPRVILLADEFQELFSFDDSLAQEATLILDRLVRQGRAFGINILLASQTLSGPNSLQSSTKNQIPIRIAMQSSEADSRMVLSEENDRAKLLERSGEAIYNAQNGRIEGNNRFQVAWQTQDERKEILEGLRQKADRDPVFRGLGPIVFDGDSPSDLVNNQELMALLTSAAWPTSRKGYTVQAWLGEPVEIKKHTSSTIRRQSRSNLLVLGQSEHEEDAIAMLLSAVLSLAAQQPPDQASFNILNLIDVDSRNHEIPELVLSNIPHPKQIVRRRGMAQVLKNLAAMVNERIEQDEKGDWPSQYLIVFGFHKAREFKRQDFSSFSSFSDHPEDEKPNSPLEDLTKIIRDGPEVGIHTLIWCDTLASMMRSFERNDIEEFQNRVALQMNSEESRTFLDSEVAAKLNPHRAIYLDDERSGHFEKFRPYGLNSFEQINQLTILLKNRKG